MERHPDLLLGTERWADAAIYRLSPEIALVQTLDFFTPIVNDPYDFGRIAAANSLSDVYAMGGRPVTAMNICCFPAKTMDKAVLREILRGGVDTVHRAGAVLAGGHSVEDRDLKFGLSVTGVVHPRRFLTNGGARPGDRLVLTKPLGTGILATALRARKLDATVTAQVTGLMAALNRGAAEAMVEAGASAATDVTGFGLAGHALEMARSSGVCIRLQADALPVIPEARALLAKGVTNGGIRRNREFCSKRVRLGPGVDALTVDILADAQTSGGLLIAVPEGRADLLVRTLLEKKTTAASIVGEVTAEPPGVIEVR